MVRDASILREMVSEINDQFFAKKIDRAIAARTKELKAEMEIPRV